jgi:hypothetical protein
MALTAIIRARSIVIALMGVGSAIAQDQISIEAAENAKQLTVMINATIDGDTRPGAGIIFALANDQVYIATADHLVRRGTSNASDIRVEFKWLPGQPQLAELLTWDYPSLDLAVVVVDGGKAHAPQTSLPFDRLGDPTKITANSAVWAIGYPNGAAYDMSPGQLNQREALRLTYRTLGIVPGGYSGGPLVDRNGLIVGMVRQDQPPNTEATRMDLLIEQLKAKDFPVALRGPGSGPPVTSTNPLRSRNPPEQKAPTSPAVGDRFKEVLQQYIRAASSGFVAVGATRGAKPPDGWTPTVTLPGSTHCGTLAFEAAPTLTLFCEMANLQDRTAADLKWSEISSQVEAVLPGPGWQREDTGDAYKRADFRNASVSVYILRAGERLGAYDVEIGVIGPKP